MPSTLTFRAPAILKKVDFNKEGLLLMLHAPIFENVTLVKYGNASFVVVVIIDHHMAKKI